MATSIKLNNGLSIPSIGLGTWKSAPGAVKAAVIAAIECGYRHIDCAAGYGNENEVGEGIADVIARGIVKREDLWVTSKLWPAMAHPQLVPAALEKTLTDLKLDYLDLYLVHWPYTITAGCKVFPAPVEERHDFNAEEFLKVWAVLEGFVDSGKLRSIGMSNMTAKKLSQLLPHMRIIPAVNQVECHPFLPQTQLQDWCQRHGNIVLTAYSPLGSPDRPVHNIFAEDPAPLHDETVLKIAAAHGVTPAQVLLRWIVQRGIAAIPKSVTPARIAANQDVFGFALTEADLKDLEPLGAAPRRIIKGAIWVVAGSTWQALWDEDFDHSQ